MAPLNGCTLDFLKLAGGARHLSSGLLRHRRSSIFPLPLIVACPWHRGEKEEPLLASRGSRRQCREGVAARRGGKITKPSQLKRQRQREAVMFVRASRGESPPKGMLLKCRGAYTVHWRRVRGVALRRRCPLPSGHRGRPPLCRRGLVMSSGSTTSRSTLA
jgi:hypothetical protein